MRPYLATNKGCVIEKRGWEMGEGRIRTARTSSLGEQITGDKHSFAHLAGEKGSCTSPSAGMSSTGIMSNSNTDPQIKYSILSMTPALSLHAHGQTASLKAEKPVDDDPEREQHSNMQ
jgi:hypothetical protein